MRFSALSWGRRRQRWFCAGKGKRCGIQAEEAAALNSALTEINGLLREAPALPVPVHGPLHAARNAVARIGALEDENRALARRLEEVEKGKVPPPARG